MSVSPGSSEQALAARCYATHARKGVKLSAAIRPHLEKSAMYVRLYNLKPAKAACLRVWFIAELYESCVVCRLSVKRVDERQGPQLCAPSCINCEKCPLMIVALRVFHCVGYASFAQSVFLSVCDITGLCTTHSQNGTAHGIPKT